MQWSVLNPIGLQEWWSKALSKQVAILNQRIEQLTQNRAKVEKAVVEIEALDMATADIDQLCAIPVHRVWRLKVLQEELALRRDLVKFDQALAAERVAETDQRFKAVQAAERSVNEKLLEMGYGEPNDTPDACAYLPLFVQRHPSVHAARNRYVELHGQQSNSVFRQMNEEAMQQVEKMLQAAKRASTAA